MRTIKISLLVPSWLNIQTCLPGSLFLCAVVLLNLLSGCAPADEATYHEMTQADLARLQAEEAGSATAAPSVAPPDNQEEKNQVQKKTEPKKNQPELMTQRSDKQDAKQTPASPSAPDKKGAKNAEATVSKSRPQQATTQQGTNSGKKGSTAAMVSPKPGSALPAKNSLNANPVRNGLLRPGLMRPGRTPPGALPEKIEKREPRLLIPEKKFRTEGKEGAIRVSFDDIDLLKVLNMEPVPENATKMFPDWLSGLNGKRIRIRGYMFPTLSQKGITYFQLVRDNEICCFGRTPKIYDRISTVLKKGETTDYIQGRPFDVIGTLRIDPIYIDGEWLQLYLLEDAVVIDDK